MKNALHKLQFIALCLLTMCQLGWAQVSKTDLQKIYVDYLTEEGFRPEIDGDGDVTFKYEGQNYYIGVDANDLEFFKIGINAVWKIDDEEELAKCLIAANFATMTTKTAKAWVRDDRVQFTLEIFVESTTSFKAVFTRCMAALSGCKANFVAKMKE